MMSVPVMTEQGLQYIPYDAYEGAGTGMMMMAYSPMGPDMYGMMQGAYGGYPGGWWGDGEVPDYGTAAGVWPRPPGAKGAQRGKGRGGSGAGASSGAPVAGDFGEIEEAEDDDDED